MPNCLTLLLVLALPKEVILCEEPSISICCPKEPGPPKVV